MRLRNIVPGTTFRYMIGDHVAETLPVFVRLAGGRILNLASGSIFTEMDDDVIPSGIPAVRGPVWGLTPEMSRVSQEVDEAQLEPRLPREEVDVDGLVDEKNSIELIGRAVRQNNGRWACLANIGGALCRVEVEMTEKHHGR